VIYQISHSYTPGAAAGLRFDDPAFGIEWPLPVTNMSEKDTTWPYVDLEAGIAI
jgi:dTDP-4-dehydrorhamnose 3,5-epimerase